MEGNKSTPRGSLSLLFSPTVAVLSTLAPGLADSGRWLSSFFASKAIYFVLFYTIAGLVLDARQFLVYACFVAVTNGWCWLDFLQCAWSFRDRSSLIYYIRYNVVTHGFDQTGLHRWACGSINQEYAWTQLTQQDRPPSWATSPSGLGVLEAVLMAPIVEELDIHIAPALMLRGLLVIVYAAGVDVTEFAGERTGWILALASGIFFAYTHIYYARLEQRVWSWPRTLALFTFFMALGTMCALMIDLDAIGRTGFLCICCHGYNNALVYWNRELMARLWFRAAFPSEETLQRARQTFTTHCKQTRVVETKANPYEAVSDFFHLYHVMPHLYHK